MTKDGITELQQWYMEHYPDSYSKDIGARRLTEWEKQLKDVYEPYSDAQIKAACKKWLYGKKSKWAPYDRELKELAGDPQVPVFKPNPNAPVPGQIMMDSDGYSYIWALERQDDPNSFTWIVCKRPGRPFRLEQ